MAEHRRDIYLMPAAAASTPRTDEPPGEEQFTWAKLNDISKREKPDELHNFMSTLVSERRKEKKRARRDWLNWLWGYAEIYRKTWAPTAAASPSRGDDLTRDEYFTEERLDEIFARGNLGELNKFIEDLNKEIQKRMKKARFVALLKLLGGAMVYRTILLTALKKRAEFDSLRIAPYGFAVPDSELSEDIALSRLEARVRGLFRWYTDRAVKEEYRAPYLPIVQSSGTGKTKLLFELAKKLQHEGDEYRCVTVLCKGSLSDSMLPEENDDTRTYSHLIDFEDKVKSSGFNRNNEFRAIENELEAILDEPDRNESNKVVFFFDEAQQLLVDGNWLPDAFKFRCIRWWLRKYRGTKQVVAVFTGTTSDLTNFYEEPVTGDAPASRGVKANYAGFDNVTKVFAPFYQLGTAGCLSRRYSPKTRESTDFDRAVPFGRPLFAVMHQQGNLTMNEPTILRRMIFVQDGKKPENWNDELAHASALASRIQMDLTAMKNLSTLVSRGYANLMDFQQRPKGGFEAKMCNDPDPVLARLCMCLMEEKWTDGRYEGQQKAWWVKRLEQLLSGGFCRPSKGTVGEMFTALYLLFCGDEIRWSKDSTYRTFSIPINAWIKNLLQHKGSNKGDWKASRTGVILKEDGKSIASSEISFIQVCRNYLRYPFLRQNDTATVSQSFLEHLYDSGCACYTYPNSERVDLLASIRVTYTDNTETYRPLFVSVKSQEKFARKPAFTATDSMRGMLERSKQGGLCLLIVFGGGPSCTAAGDADWEKMLHHIDTTPVTVVIRLQDNDKFGLSAALSSLSSFMRDEDEILASTPMLRGHERSEFDDDELLRDDSKSVDAFKDLRNQIDVWSQQAKLGAAVGPDEGTAVGTTVGPV